MAMFNFFKQPDINSGVEAFMATDGAVLLDVRTAAEYREGHIPGSQNVPLQQLEEFASMEDTPVYVYCRSGARSRQAAAILRSMGYTNVRNIGGITAYTGFLNQ